MIRETALRRLTAPPRMRLSSARLAALFVVIFAAAITLVLTAVYILTARVLDREVDAVIRSEVSASRRRLCDAAACCSWSRPCAAAPTAGAAPARSIC